MLIRATGLLALISFGGSNAVAVSGLEEPAGQELFVERRCTTCHSVEAAGLDARRSDAGPDLSNTGDDVPSAEWVTEYLLRKVEKSGKKHKRPYKGNEEELETIVDWLLALKSAER